MKKHLWSICFSALLVAFTVYIALDTFVLASNYNTNAVEMNTSMFAETAAAETRPVSPDEQPETQADTQPDAETAAESERPDRTGRPERNDTTADRSGDPNPPTGKDTSENTAASDSAVIGEESSGTAVTQSGSDNDEPSRSSSSSRSRSRSSSSRSSWSGRSSDYDDTDDTSDSSGWSSWSGRGSDYDDTDDWSGSSGRSSRSDRSSWSGRSYMNSAESAEGVDAAAEYTGDTTYSDDNISITLTEVEQYSTTIYVADVTVSSTIYIKAAFANDTYGKNVTESTSAMAVSHNAILAINGDYYGAQERGYVIRNGIVYRDSAAGEDVMCIYADGTMGIVSDRDYSAEELVENGVWQAFTFGPALVEDGELAVSPRGTEGRNSTSNPRTAVGMIDTNHYVFVVADGRSGESDGLTLYELAQFMQSLGVKVAYNLDGGGSSTMFFNGQVVNNPTSWSGTGIKERGVSDIVYVG